MRIFFLLGMHFPDDTFGGEGLRLFVLAGHERTGEDQCSDGESVMATKLHGRSFDQLHPEGKLTEAGSKIGSRGHG